MDSEKRTNEMKLNNLSINLFMSQVDLRNILQGVFRRQPIKDMYPDLTQSLCLVCFLKPFMFNGNIESCSSISKNRTRERVGIFCAFSGDTLCVD